MEDSVGVFFNDLRNLLTFTDSHFTLSTCESSFFPCRLSAFVNIFILLFVLRPDGVYPRLALICLSSARIAVLSATPIRRGSGDGTMGHRTSVHARHSAASPLFSRQPF